MKGLFGRIHSLQADSIPFILDFITMRAGGFVYRNATVVTFDEHSVFITQEDREGMTYLKMSEIASARIIPTV